MLPGQPETSLLLPPLPGQRLTLGQVVGYLITRGTVAVAVAIGVTALAGLVVP